MIILWDHVFSKLVPKKMLRKLRDGQDVTIKVTIEQIRDVIRSFSPRTNPDCVCESWINDAMSMFKKMNVVTGEVSGSFTITYKKHNMDTTEWIMGKTANGGKGSAGARGSKNSSGGACLDGYL